MSNQAKRWQRQIKFVPRPKHEALIQAMARVNEMPPSQVVHSILNDYFGKMPEQERHALIARSKNHY